VINLKKIIIIISAIIVLSIAGISACSILFIGNTVSNENEKDQQVNKAIKGETKSIIVTAKQLQEEFNDNEVAAMQKYKSKVLEVTGIVKDITESNIFLESHNDKIENMFFQICCEFPDTEKNNVAKLTKDKEITIVGLCDGESLFGDIQLNKCKVKKY
jgi:hypothetical protein